MGIESAPFYWVICDGCGVKSTEGGEYAAWKDQNQAEEDALAGDWSSNGKGGWLCLDCGPFCDCGAHAGPLSGEREYMCPECAGAEVSA